MKEDSRDATIKEEWKGIAIVLDRFLFWISFIFIVVLVISIFSQQDPEHQIQSNVSKPVDTKTTTEYYWGGGVVVAQDFTFSNLFTVYAETYQSCFPTDTS